MDDRLPRQGEKRCCTTRACRTRKNQGKQTPAGVVNIRWDPCCWQKAALDQRGDRGGGTQKGVQGPENEKIAVSRRNWQREMTRISKNGILVGKTLPASAAGEPGSKSQTSGPRKLQRRDRETWFAEGV